LIEGEHPYALRLRIMPLTVAKRALVAGGPSNSKMSSSDSLQRVGSFESDKGVTTAYDASYFPASPYIDNEDADAYESFVYGSSESREATIASLLNVVETEVNTMGALAAVADLVALATRRGLTSSEGVKIVVAMVDLIRSVKEEREGGLLLLKLMLLRMGRRVEPFALPLLPKVLSMVADRIQAVRDLAQSISSELTFLLNPYSFRTVLPVLLQAMTDEDWRVKVVALNFLRQISPRVNRQVSALLPEIIPAVSECILNTKPQVMQAGLDTLTEACRAITNDDIRHLVPQLVSVIAHPEESERTLNALLETTFVATVDAATLALIAPTLGKALRSRSSPFKRKAARVIDNMCRLVTDPSDVAPFAPMLLPFLNKVIDEIVDEEVKEVSVAARAILLRALGEGNVTPNSSSSNLRSGVVVSEEATGSHHADAHVFTRAFTLSLSMDHVCCSVAAALAETLGEPLDATRNLGTKCDCSMVANYVSSALATLLVYDTVISAEDLRLNNIDISTVEPWRVAVALSQLDRWKDCVIPYAFELIDSEADGSCDFNTARMRSDALSTALRVRALDGLPDAAAAREAEDGSLCDFEFSLAFGAKILLHQARLRLGQGRKYAIMGKNGAGKTTLLTHMASGHIEGLPLHVKTTYVQHDDSSDDNGMSLIEELLVSREMMAVGVTREEAVTALKQINFTDGMLQNPRNSLSGGWKMKLLIIRAMLSKANVLLLDEPTNHLDQNSVTWLTEYLKKATELTCLIVSHDTAFLDNVITDVIHYESRKLVYYHGNLTHFVDIHPEARYYHSLEASTMEFKFPVPDRLDGINSVTKSVLKMVNVTYTYPGSSKPTLKDVSVKLALGSRVGIVGANGAGKSTLIKILVQESEPDVTDPPAEVWKHPNLRVAYVAQHSLHHVDQHLDISPVDYIKWRFHGGVDKEAMEKATTKLTEEEKQEFKGERKYGDVVDILGRRKNGRTMEYECTFVGQTARDANKYISVEELEARGYSKLVQQCDVKVAAMAAGLDVRPLLTVEIQTHLNDFNLDSEFGTHSTIRRLSGGQKVKLVLAAAMWNKPHLIVLDEPTNYLDREALGALTQAIKNFAGGVVIISHHSEFVDRLCPTKWVVANGECSTVGEIEDEEGLGGAKVKAESNKMKKSKSGNLDKSAIPDADAVGNINKAIVSEVVLNPKTLEGLSKKETRLLTRCAEVAGMSLKDYVKTLNCKSPEWKWL